MSRRRQKEVEMPGTDSFLDVVANLVGILIILVVIIGASAASSWATTAESNSGENQLESVRSQLKQLEKEALNYEANNREIRTKIQTEDSLIALKRRQRHQLLVEEELLRSKFEQQVEKFDQKRKQQLERRVELESLKRQLATLQKTLEQVPQSSQPKRESIEHFPTPLAKTVFNREYHFQIKNGKVTPVPIDALVDLVKQEINVKAEKLKSGRLTHTIETVGPVGNFRMQYLLVAGKRMVPTAAGPVAQRTVEFQRFILLPVSDSAGEDFDRVLAPQGMLYELVSNLDPQRSTISLWTYPDSYREFRKIKQWLYEQGFQTAVWPLPENAPISGGPKGLRSSSQ